MTKPSVLLGLYLLLQASLNAEGTVGAFNTSGQENITHLTGMNGSLNASDPFRTWIITVPEGNLVKLKTHNTSLRNSTLEIRDGQDSSSEALEILTGNHTNEQQTVFSSGRHLWVRLQSFQEKGVTLVAVFEAVKQAVVGSCRNGKVVELNNTTGRIFPPMLPEDFPRGIACTWLITAPEGLYVRLKIEKLDVDQQNSSLYVRDGKTSSSPLLNKECDLEAKSTVFSSGRYLWVQFSAKKAIYDISGFEALFTVVKQSQAPCAQQGTQVELKKESGTLSSYKHPSRYYKHHKCTWRFMTRNKVELRICSFNLSYSKDCAEEYLEIHRERYCGSKKPALTVTLEGSDKRVKYKSDGLRHTGFMARYTSRGPKDDHMMTTLLVSISGSTFFLILAFFCYQCLIRPHHCEDDDDKDMMDTLVTECPQSFKVKATV